MMQAYFITDIMLDPSEQKVEKHFNCPTKMHVWQQIRDNPQETTETWHIN